MGSGNTPLVALFAEKTTATAGLIERFEGLRDPEIRPLFHKGGNLAGPTRWFVAISTELRNRT